MPTATKIFAALAFALVGWLAASAYIPLLPDGTSTGYFREITAALGFLVGWISLGSSMGQGYVEAASRGLAGSAVLLVSTLLGFSVYRMILRSTKMLYNDAGEALLDVPMLMLFYGKVMGSTAFIGTLVVGGILGGLAAEFAARRWR